MMKSLIAGVLLAAPVLANAYTWQDSIDFNPNPQLTLFNTFSYTHDITKDGFVAGSDNVSGYSVTINLINDQGLLDAFYINQPGVSGDSAGLLYNWTYTSLTTQGSYQGIASLNNNGLLNVSITSLLGTFYVDSSTLVATGTQDARNSQSVPEPTSVALLAAGLLGIAVMRRNNKAA